MRAPRTTACPLVVTVAGTSVTGLSLVVAIRDSATLNSYLDFADSTFKTAGWTTREAALQEVGAGTYQRLFNASATNLPSTSKSVVAEYRILTVPASGVSEVIELEDTDLSGDIAALTAAVASNTVAIGGIATDVDAVQLGVGVLQTQVTNIDGDIATVDAHVLAQSASIAAVTADVAGVLAAVGDLQTDVDLLPAQIAGVGTAVGVVHNQATNIQTSIDLANASLGDIDNDLTAINASVGAVNVSVAAATSAVATVSTQVSGLDASITSIGDAVAAVAVDVTSMAADIDAVQIAIADVHDIVALINKYSKNKMKVNIASQRLELYDDDNTSILQYWPLATTGGEPVATALGVQTERGAPVL